MNATFRRDYLYNIKEGMGGLLNTEGSLRYLRYDRQTREYIFITGESKRSTEKFLRFNTNFGNAVYRRLSKGKYIGYEPTNGYGKNLGAKDTSTKSLMPDEFVIGNTYKFTVVNTGVYISDKPLKYTGSDSSYLNFEFSKGYGIQICDVVWLLNGLVTAKEVL